MDKIGKSIPFERSHIPARGVQTVLHDTLDRTKLPKFPPWPWLARKHCACICGKRNEPSAAADD